jgi:hypothetical protein
VIGVVPSFAVHLTAQLRPGQGIRFHQRASDNRTPH